VLDLDVCGQERPRAVVLRPVELDAAGDPRARESDERRLDHGVAVEEVVTGAAVVPHVDPAAQLGQHQHPQPPVLQVHRRPLDGRLHGADPIVERQRVDAAGGALVHAAVQVGGVAVGPFREVAVDRQRVTPDGHPGVRLFGRAGWELQS
jgi:hypothetical protein